VGKNKTWKSKTGLPQW